MRANNVTHTRGKAGLQASRAGTGVFLKVKAVVTEKIRTAVQVIRTVIPRPLGIKAELTGPVESEAVPDKR